MEYVAIIILALIGISFFKKSINRVAKYTDQIIVTNISEGQQELISRSQEAYDAVIEAHGEDFMTPDEVYNKLHKKVKKTALPLTNNSNQN